MSLWRRISVSVWTLLTASTLLCGLANAQEQAAATTAPDQTADQTTGNTDPSAAPDDGLHLGLTGYLWTPGLNGTIGAHGYDAGVRASPAQLLSHFHFGLMGRGEARKKRLVSTIDFMWVKLTASEGRATPFPDVPTISARAGFNQFILTPKVGFRVIDNKNFTIDGLAGFRYWHLGTTLEFTPPPQGNNFSRSVNWVDPVVGPAFSGTLKRAGSFHAGGRCRRLGQRSTNRLSDLWGARIQSKTQGSGGSGMALSLRELPHL